MTSLENIHLAVLGCYLVGSLLVLAGAVSGNQGLKRSASYLALAAFGLHTLDLGWVLVEEGKMALLTSGFHLSFLAWTLLLIYILVWWRLKFSYLATTALPLALLMYISSLAIGGLKVTIPPALTGLFFGLHIGSLAVSLALMALAFGSGVAFLRVNRKLKTKTALADMDQGLPSLEIFDRINHWAVVLGFLCFTLGITASFAWYWVMPDKAFHWDAMNITTLAVWLLFAVLFHQRIALGWKGRKPAIYAMAVFVFMVIALLHHTITFNRIQ